MDKNQFTGMALMALCIFFFLWWMRPSEKELRAQREAQQQAQNAIKAEQKAASAPSLLGEDAAGSLGALVRTHGTPVEGSTAYRYANPTLDVTATPVDSAKYALSGSVYVNADTIDINRVLSNDLLDYSPEQAARAHVAVNSVINTLAKYKSFGPFFYGQEELTVLENDQLRVAFSNRGGMVQEVTLKQYKTETTSPATDVTLFNKETGNYRFAFVTSDQRIYTDSLYFRTTEVTDSSLVMSLPLGKGVEWNIRYTLVPDIYIVKMDIEQRGVEAVIPPSCTTVNFDWRQKMGRNEKGRTFEERYSSLFYKFTDETPHELSSSKDESEKLNGRIKWVAFKNQFFSSVIIPRTYFTQADVTSVELKNNPDYVKNMRMTGIMPYSSQESSPMAFDFYFGPNDYPLLSSIDKKIDAPEDLDLNRLVPLGWSLFRWINQLIVIPVFTYLSHFTHNYGIIILLLTLFIKLILFPFTYKSYKSQAKMRLLAPEIKEINEKYPGQENAMKRQQETMALYSRAGASPFSGCLPLLLQMPVLIAMFAFFPSAIELRGQSFLWVHDLSAPDYICTLPFTIPWYGNQVSLFCLLMTVVNVVYIQINMASQPTQSSMPGMKVMMYLMPVMYLFFFNDYAAGLSYYYFLSLIITIIQTYAFRWVIDEKKMRQQMLENAKKPRKKKSGLMARLEEAQRKQEAMLRQQQAAAGKKRK